jgi:hypothetical protein
VKKKKKNLTFDYFEVKKTYEHFSYKETKTPHTSEKKKKKKKKKKNQIYE